MKRPPCRCNPVPNPYQDIMSPAAMPPVPPGAYEEELSYGVKKFVEVHETPDRAYEAVRLADGTTRLVPHAHCPGGHAGDHNGPMFMPGNDAYGEISSSEGMDAPNFWFNNSDCGQNF